MRFVKERFYICLGLIALLFLIAIFAPILSTHDPEAATLALGKQPPSSD